MAQNGVRFDKQALIVRPTVRHDVHHPLDN